MKRWILGAALGAMAVPAVAAEEDRKAELEALTALATAQADLQTARTALVTAQITALGLNSGATGKTELKDKGGELEGWMLSAQSLDSAAQTVATSFSGNADRPVVLLAADEAFDLALVASVRLRLEAARDRLNIAIGSGCAPPAGVKGIAVAGAGLAAVLPYAGALLGALKTDTEITGVAGPTEARLLVHAIAGKPRAGGWIIPADAGAMPEGSAILGLWRNTLALRARAVGCRTVLAASTAAADKEKAALLADAISVTDTLESDLVRGTSVPTVLVKAIRIDEIARARPLVLRVYVEKAGGTILLRKNLWTTFGAPAVGVTGGSVVSWRLVEPTTGASSGGGLVFCTTRLTTLRRAHAARHDADNCRPVRPPAERETVTTASLASNGARP